MKNENKNFKCLKFQLIWNVITLSKPLTQAQIKKVKRIDFSAGIADNAILSNGAPDNLTERVNAVLAVIADRKEMSIRFTDYQFGLSVNSYNGVCTPSRALKNNVIVKDGNRFTAIPVTVMQIKRSL